MDTVWDYIKSIYRTKFNIKEIVIDYIAVNDILNMSVNGFSNTTIARELDTDCRYVRDAVTSFLKFYGWDNDLDISPIYIYNYCKNDYLLFVSKCKAISPVLSREDIFMAYSICKEYNKIQKEIENYNDKT